MAGGSDDFFDEVGPQAVFKHALFKQYAAQWASRVGKLSADLYLLDGYAGAGEYGDGRPGSPLLALDAIAKQRQRTLHCVFVERSRSKARALEAAIAAKERPNAETRVICGALEHALDQELERAAGFPLLVLLDPFTTALPKGDVVRIARRRGATDVLLVFMQRHVNRTVGHFLSPEVGIEVAVRGKVDNLTRFLGGEWWQETATRVCSGGGSTGQAADAIASRYLNEVAREANVRGYAVDVRPRPGNQTIYKVMLFAQHPMAGWVFCDCAARARSEWLDWCEQERGLKVGSGTPQLELGSDFGFFAAERVDEAEAVAAICRQTLDALADGGPFVAFERTREILGDYAGLASATHVRRALRRLAERGEITLDATPRDPANWRVSAP